MFLKLLQVCRQQRRLLLVFILIIEFFLEGFDLGKGSFLIGLGIAANAA